MPFGAQFWKIQTQEPEQITNLHCQFKKKKTTPQKTQQKTTMQKPPPNPKTKPENKPQNHTDTRIPCPIKNTSPIIGNCKKREIKFLLYHIISSSKYVTYKIMLTEKVNPSTGKYKQANWHSRNGFPIVVPAYHRNTWHRLWTKDWKC